MKDLILKRVALICVLVLAIVMSFTFAADYFSSVETHQATIQSIDNKIDTALKLSASSAGVSAGLTLIPGDVATPIAEKFADLTQYFLLSLCVLYAEKYLLTLLGAAVFRILVPLALVLAIAGIFRYREVLWKISVRLICIGLVLLLAIPVSIHISDMIYDTYQASIDDTVSSADSLTDTTSLVSQASGDEGLLSSLLSGISETVSGLVDKATSLFSRFLETLAVVTVTTCVIPLLVLAFFLWLVKVVTGIEITVPHPYHLPPHSEKLPGEGERRG